VESGYGGIRRLDKPTDLISQVMAGTADYNFLPVALQSAIRLPIYARACAVLAEPTKEAKRAKLESEPDSVRGLIETEALRLYKLRRKGLQ